MSSPAPSWWHQRPRLQPDARAAHAPGERRQVPLEEGERPTKPRCVTSRGADRLFGEQRARGRRCGCRSAAVHRVSRGARVERAAPLQTIAAMGVGAARDATLPPTRTPRARRFYPRSASGARGAARVVHPARPCVAPRPGGGTNGPASTSPPGPRLATTVGARRSWISAHTTSNDPMSGCRGTRRRLLTCEAASRASPRGASWPPSPRRLRRGAHVPGAQEQGLYTR